MEKIQIIEDNADMPPREIASDVATYKKQLFGMFSGEATEVHVEMDKSLRNSIYDLFGDHIVIYDHGENHVRFKVNVQVSHLFFGWCCSFGDKLKLVGPENIVAELKEYTKALTDIYV
jgi:predicted DNA-binding transcriptional regulator YafY